MARIGRSLEELAREIERRAETKRDYIAPTSKLLMGVSPMNSKPVLELWNGDVHKFDVQEHAHGQLAEYTDIPMAYYRRMMNEDPNLLASNVNRWLHEKSGAKDGRRMIRTLDGQVRAVLSDKYRALENEDLADAVLPVLLDMNLMFLSCEITDRRLYIKCVDRSIERDVPTGRKMGDASHSFFDTVSPAITISNSEIGSGALSIETGVYTRVCTNLCMIGSNMRKYHTGARASVSDEVMALLTDETKRATDKAVWMQVRDMVQSAFELSKFEALAQRVGNASQDVIESDDVVQVVERVGKRFTLNEGERKGVLSRLIEGGDLTRYGVHAAITRYSADSDSYDRATELERIGGDVIELNPGDWRELTTTTKRLAIAA
jgi:hypothetical protein